MTLGSSSSAISPGSDAVAESIMRGLEDQIGMLEGTVEYLTAKCSRLQEESVEGLKEQLSQARDSIMKLQVEKEHLLFQVKTLKTNIRHPLWTRARPLNGLYKRLSAASARDSSDI